MKKVLFTAIAVMCAVFAFTTTSMAGLEDLKPRTDGNDVIVPDMVIQAIPNYDPDKPVYAAHDINAWLTKEDIPEQIREATEMKKRDDGSWVAEDMKGEIFHPTQVQDGEAVPAKLEDVYMNVEEFDFIDWSGAGPSLKVE